MGWVTLNCRSKEDQCARSYYQLRLLQVSREQRQRARYYQSESTKIQNNQRVEIQQIMESYNARKEELQDTLNYAKTLKSVRKKEEDGSELTDEEQELMTSLAESESAYKDSTSEQLQASIDVMEESLNTLIEQKTEDINDKKLYYDEESELNEQMAADEDLIYEQDKTDIETQLEAITTEYNSVKDSASQEISNTAIKLS